MSNLLDVLIEVEAGRECNYDIASSKLNPTKSVYEKTKTEFTHNKKDFGKSELKKFIIDNSEELYNNGNMFRAEIKGDKLKLIILKRLS